MVTYMKRENLRLIENLLLSYSVSNLSLFSKCKARHRRTYLPFLLSRHSFFSNPCAKLSRVSGGKRFRKAVDWSLMRASLFHFIYKKDPQVDVFAPRLRIV